MYIYIYCAYNYELYDLRIIQRRCARKFFPFASQHTHTHNEYIFNANASFLLSLQSCRRLSPCSESQPQQCSRPRKLGLRLLRAGVRVLFRFSFTRMPTHFFLFFVIVEPEGWTFFIFFFFQTHAHAFAYYSVARTCSRENENKVLCWRAYFSSLFQMGCSAMHLYVRWFYSNVGTCDCDDFFFPFNLLDCNVINSARWVMLRRSI